MRSDSERQPEHALQHHPALVSAAIENGSIMSDEWKWVLRSATATRPVLRFTPGFDAAGHDRPHRAAVSRTRAAF